MLNAVIRIAAIVLSLVSAGTASVLARNLSPTSQHAEQAVTAFGLTVILFTGLGCAALLIASFIPVLQRLTGHKVERPV